MHPLLSENYPWDTSYTDQLSLITVVLEVSLVLEFPRNKATRRMMNTAPPTTHTHGWVYHVVVVFVVVVVLELAEVSWATRTICMQTKTIARNSLYPSWKLRLFIQRIFVLKNNYTYNTDNILPNMFKRKERSLTAFAGELFLHFFQ